MLMRLVVAKINKVFITFKNRKTILFSLFFDSSEIFLTSIREQYIG